MVIAMSQPLYTRDRAPVPIVEEIRWTSGAVWTGLKKNSAHWG